MGISPFLVGNRQKCRDAEQHERQNQLPRNERARMQREPARLGAVLGQARGMLDLGRGNDAIETCPERGEGYRRRDDTEKVAIT
jgi:hypothetical protein